MRGEQTIGVIGGGLGSTLIVDATGTPIPTLWIDDDVAQPPPHAGTFFPPTPPFNPPMRSLSRCGDQAGPGSV